MNGFSYYIQLIFHKKDGDKNVPLKVFFLPVNDNGNDKQTTSDDVEGSKNVQEKNLPERGGIDRTRISKIRRMMYDMRKEAGSVVTQWHTGA